MKNKRQKRNLFILCSVLIIYVIAFILVITSGPHYKLGASVLIVFTCCASLLCPVTVMQLLCLRSQKRIVRWLPSLMLLLYIASYYVLLAYENTHCIKFYIFNTWLDPEFMQAAVPFAAAAIAIGYAIHFIIRRKRKAEGADGSNKIVRVTTRFENIEDFKSDFLSCFSPSYNAGKYRGNIENNSLWIAKEGLFHGKTSVMRFCGELRSGRTITIEGSFRVSPRIYFTFTPVWFVLFECFRHFDDIYSFLFSADIYILLVYLIQRRSKKELIKFLEEL